jgi:hypothetical protein
VIIPNLGWVSFLKDATDSVKHGITRSVDNSNQRLNELAKFLVTLQELRTNEVANPRDVLKAANTLLHHLSFSLLISGSSAMIFKILEITTLHSVAGKAEKGRVVLLSGTLGEWKLATIDLCNAKNTDLRWCGQTLLEFFFKLGLDGVFANYDRKIRRDGTLLLEYKS